MSLTKHIDHQEKHSRTPLITGNIYCLLAAMAWSLGFPAGSVLMQSWDLLTLLVIRLLPSTIILLIYWRLTAGPLPLDRIIWKKGLIIGAIGFGFGTVLLLYGQHISNPVTPAIAAAMMPIMGAILEIVLDRRRLTIRLAMGITCALIGGLMAAGVRWHGYDIGVGFIWCLAAVMIYAWATRATTVNLKQLSSIGQTTVTLAGAGLFISMIWLIMAFIDPMQISIGTMTANSLLMLFAFSILSAAISQPLWIAGAGKLGVAIASFHLNAVPVYVMAIMVYGFDGQWDSMRLIGAVIVGLGVIIAQTEPVRHKVV
jgi:drug/metabolite transporter (DMT)-like permease